MTLHGDRNNTSAISELPIASHVHPKPPLAEEAFAVVGNLDFSLQLFNICAGERPLPVIGVSRYSNYAM